MAKAAPTNRRAELEAELAALDAADADDVELWVRKDGVETKLTGGHAKKWLENLGFTDDGDGDDEDGDEDGDEEDPAPAKKGFFGQPVKAAKAAAK